MKEKYEYQVINDRNEPFHDDPLTALADAKRLLREANDWAQRQYEDDLAYIALIVKKHGPQWEEEVESPYVYRIQRRVLSPWVDL